MSTARRNPEAILVLAAGVALLMRGGSRSRRRYPIEENRGASMDVYREGEYEEEGRAAAEPRPRGAQAGSPASRRRRANMPPT